MSYKTQVTIAVTDQNAETIGISEDIVTPNEFYTLDPNNGTLHQNHLEVWTVAVGVVLSLIIFCTILGNALVIIAVFNFRRLRSVTNLFVVSLAIADITVAILVMPYSLLFEVFGEWRLGWIFCYFWISCDVTCCTASILHLCVISLDRYLAITQPLTYRVKMPKRRAVALICGVWVCSVAISFVPIFLGWFADLEQMELYQDSPECGLYVNRIYAVISSTTSFYLPLMVMLCAYLKIFRIARKQAMEIKKLENCLRLNGTEMKNKLNRRSKRLSKDTKAIKTLGTLMGLFCICWVPFFLMYIILPFCENCKMPPVVMSFITWLGYANSFINPGVYAFLQRDFRIAFKKILFCGKSRICCQCRILPRKKTKTKSLETTTEKRDLPAGLYEYVLADRNNSNCSIVPPYSSRHFGARHSGSTSTSADRKSVTTLE